MDGILSLVVKAVADSDHKVVGISEAVELISYMEKETLYDMYLQCKNLIEMAIVRVGENVIAKTCVYRKYRHYELSAG